jgi:single-stranded DNA-binding protein
MSKKTRPCWFFLNRRIESTFHQRRKKKLFSTKKKDKDKDVLDDLNSTLIEGIVSVPPYKVSPANASVCHFELANRRYFGKNLKTKKLVKEVSSIPVEVTGELSKNILHYAKLGNEVRIVGYLKKGNFYNSSNKKDITVYIVAEHVEKRPETTEK